MSANISMACIAILITCNILIACLVSLVAYNAFHENQGSTLNTRARAGITSIMCDTLSMHPNDDWETFDLDKSKWKISVNSQGAYMCSTRNVTDIVEKIVEKSSRIRLSSGLDGPQYLACGNQSLAPPSGEMTAYFTRVSRHQNVTETEIHGKVIWDKHSSHSYINPKIAYENGELTIPEGRTYFVYASVTFNLSKTEEKPQNRPYKLSLRICRKIYGYERTLLGKVEIYNSRATDIVSLNVAGHILLQKDDVLLVRVSNAQELHHNSKGNAFGLFPL